MEREIKHFSHEHPLFLNEGEGHRCDGCRTLISGPFYRCKECDYDLDKVCAELPPQIKHSTHPQHPLTLLSKTLDSSGYTLCNICENECERFVYNCTICNYNVDIICVVKYKWHPHPLPSSQQIKHFSHEHPLFLDEDGGSAGTNTCDGCLKPIWGPFYSCADLKCYYNLHKVCGELPPQIDHPMHPQHPLTLLLKTLDRSGYCFCKICGGQCDQFVYNCATCKFDVDMICASASYTIKDKCHPHPLTPLQLSIPFLCNICHMTEEGDSYRCSICPFWVHQKCTLILPNTIKHIDHIHPLTLLPSIPHEHSKVSENCDICHARMPMFCVYYCGGCKFFAHAKCAMSKSQVLRDANAENKDKVLAQCQVLLPMRKESIDLISRFVKDHTDLQDNEIKNKIDHFGHHHPLFLFDEQLKEKICEACAQPISAPSYGCSECDYFLHKCCTELPKHIVHPFHPEHKLDLFAEFSNPSRIFPCQCCLKLCNCFGYTCSECEQFYLDIHCASLIGPIEHEAHKHDLVPRMLMTNICSACDGTHFGCSLQCNECNFSLHQVCAMLPPIVNHRYDKHPFRLTYLPIADHYDEYYCEICEEELNPKLWFYHCHPCDQFVHSTCMFACAADSNIKYGKLYTHSSHQHKLNLVSFSDNYSNCNNCYKRLNIKFCAGFECTPCNFRIHLSCEFQGGN